LETHLFRDEVQGLGPWWVQGKALALLAEGPFVSGLRPPIVHSAGWSNIFAHDQRDMA